jgi:hypothetical protein
MGRPPSSFSALIPIEPGIVAAAFLVLTALPWLALPLRSG